MAPWKNFDPTDVSDTWVPGEKVVMGGQKISEIVDNINSFTKSVSGELVILDLRNSISDCAQGESKDWKDFKHTILHQKDDGKPDLGDAFFRETPFCAAKNITFSTTETMTLMKELERLEALWRPEGGSMNLPYDLTTVPISTWLDNGKSTVLVKLTDDLTAALNETMSLKTDLASFDGSAADKMTPTWGIIHDTRMPTKGATAGPQGNGEVLAKMAVDEIIEFGGHKDGLLRSRWMIRPDDVRAEGHPVWQGAESKCPLGNHVPVICRHFY